MTKQKWTKPAYGSQACGMEVNMYAPDEDNDVLFRATSQGERHMASTHRPLNIALTPTRK